MSTMFPDEFPRVLLRAPDQAQAEVFLNGGHLASWVTPDGHERLFLSGRTALQPGTAIRGGVPVVFPQFSNMGPLPNHGVAHTAQWDHVSTQSDASGRVAAHFRLEDSAETRRVWDQAFRLDLMITIGGAQLEIALQVTNTGERPYDFTAALHTYFRVQDIADVWVEGLGGMNYREHDVNYTQTETQLHIEGEINRRYWNVPGSILLHEGKHSLEIWQSGFRDAVIWNPGPKKGATLSDLEPAGYRRMLCIEAAVIGQRPLLAAGAVWRGLQQITVLR